MASSFDTSRAVRHLKNADAVLGAWIDRFGPFTLEVPARVDLFTALARSITYQQLSGKAAATIFGRVCALFPRRRFPRPEALLAIDVAHLRAAGLSASKAAAMRDLAARMLDRTIPSLKTLQAMDDEEIIERLSTVRGVGRWTAEMVLIFHLGRPDVLPLGDYGVRKGFSQLFRRRDVVSPDVLARHGERWRPFRTVASWYLWRAIDAQ